jgi:signal recognition particle subunit SRP54
VFDTLQDRLAATFKNLRGKGRLSDADIDATLARSGSRCSRLT